MHPSTPNRVEKDAREQIATTHGRLRRFRFRSFSLRFFLLSVTAFCVWFSIQAGRANKQKAAIKVINEHGGTVRYGFELTNDSHPWVPEFLLHRIGVDFFYSVAEVNFIPGGKLQTHPITTSDPAPLEQLKHFPNLKRLYLSDSQANDENLCHVGKLRQLEWLMMYDAHEVSDLGVTHFADLENLEYFMLTDSAISDESLRILGSLTNLDSLNLQFNSLTDDGVEFLAPLTNLRVLAICGRAAERNGITDESLTVFAELTNLKTLVIQRTQITDAGETAFSTISPCSVIR